MIPALNEQDSLPGTLADLRAHAPELDVLVVDDGSTDATAAVAAREGAICLELPFNLGIGGALRTGFRYAVDNGYDRALQFDADGQHDATQIPALLAELDRGADMVVGTRFAGEGDYQVGRSRGLAMGMLRWTIRVLAGKKLHRHLLGVPGLRHRRAAHLRRRLPDRVHGLGGGAGAGLSSRLRRP